MSKVSKKSELRESSRSVFPPKRANSYFNPKLQDRKVLNKGSHGVFATENIRAGEMLLFWGGDVYTRKELIEMPQSVRSMSVQVEEDLYLVSTYPGPGDWINHSCNPNAGIKGQAAVVAIRDISAGEEICYDYAMTDSSSYDEFACACGADCCRKMVTGNDWKLPELWQRYNGFFSMYLQRRIAHLTPEEGPPTP